MRTRLSLDGTWEICPDRTSAPFTESAPPASGWRPARVPCPWQLLAADGLPEFGAVWYRRFVEVPGPASDAEDGGVGPGPIHVLVFEAANRHAQIWVDGSEVTRNTGGDLPFEAHLGRLGPGRHEILVRVQLPDDEGSDLPGFGGIPHGKQSWYGPVGGLWRSVALETRPAGHLRRVRCRADGARGTVEVKVERTAEAHGAPLRVLVEDPSGTEVAAASTGEPDSPESLSVMVDQPIRWGPGTPHTYLVRVQLLGREDEVLDEVVQRVGFRVLEVRGSEVALNGTPVELRGVLDQDYWPATDWTPPGPHEVEQQLTWIRDAGFNLLRYHVKVPDQHYLDLADRLGLMVWLEVPNWRDFTEATAAEARQLLESMVEDMGRHPCVVAWSVVNESWGVDLADPRQRDWVLDAVAWLRARPEGWLVVDNSPCHPNGHLDTDLEDYHFYAGLPDHRERWDGFLRAFVDREAPTYEAGWARQGRPLVLSEFGFWSLPSPRPSEGVSPSWRAERGPSWGNAIAEPAGLLSRFHALCLDQVFGDYATMAEATQRQQSQALRYAVATLRRASVGYAVTELTDVYWEANGLLDQWRRPKAGLDALTRVNGDVAVLLHLGTRAYWSEEELQVDVRTVGAPSDARPRLHFDGVSCAWPPDRVLTAPRVSEGRRVVVTATLETPGGDVLASDEVELVVLPRPASERATTVSIATVEADIAAALQTQGWTAEDVLGPSSAWFVSRVDAAAVEHLRSGGTVVLLAADQEALGELSWSFPLMELTATSGFDSDWMLRTSWLRRDSAFAHLPGGPLLGWEFAGLTPDLGLAHVFASEYRHRVHAGSTMGWLHQPVATLVTRRVGLGTVILCTWRLADQTCGTPAIRGAVLDGVVALCQPPIGSGTGD